jgi:hypothetical protein
MEWRKSTCGLTLVIPADNQPDIVRRGNGVFTPLRKWESFLIIICDVVGNSR